MPVTSRRPEATRRLQPTRQPGLFTDGRELCTINLTPGRTFFELEHEFAVDGVRYRVIDPRRSKFAAAIAKGLQQTGLKQGSIVLYLGASHGYTPSFFSDIVGSEGRQHRVEPPAEDAAGRGGGLPLRGGAAAAPGTAKRFEAGDRSVGMIFCLDFAPRVVRDLYGVCRVRENMAPLMADAGQPATYADVLPATVDVVYQDIAQRNQVEIFLKNCDRFLASGGYGMLAVKARSIDVTKRPQDLFRRIRQELEALPGYAIVDYRELDPFEKDHAFFVVRKVARKW